MAKMKKISLSSFEVKHYLREPAIITVPIIKMADEQASQTSNPLSRKLNKILEMRFDNDKVIHFFVHLCELLGFGEVY